MNNKIFYFLLFYPIWLPLPSRASSSVDIPYTYVSSPDGSSFFFIMDKDERGVCYLVKNSEDISTAWKTSGWYAFPGELILSKDGRSLNRFIPIVESETQLSDHKCLEFYYEGKLVRTYTMRDLKIDPNKLVGYIYEPSKKILIGGQYGIRMLEGEKLLKILSEERNARTLANYEGAENLHRQFLLLETIDKQRFVFDIRNGNIVVKESFE